MTTTPEQFQTYLDAPEGTRLEFKSATGGFHFEELIKRINQPTAMANKITDGINSRQWRKLAQVWREFGTAGRTNNCPVLNRLEKTEPA